MVWYNKENPAKRVNEMNIGEKIKRIRQHRRKIGRASCRERV